MVHLQEPNQTRCSYEALPTPDNDSTRTKKVDLPRKFFSNSITSFQSINNTQCSCKEVDHLEEDTVEEGKNLSQRTAWLVQRSEGTEGFPLKNVICADLLDSKFAYWFFRGHTGPGQGGRGSGPRGGNKGHYQRRSDGSESLENDVEQFLELTSCTDVSCTLHELTSYMPNVGTLPELTSLVNVSTLPYPTRISATRWGGETANSLFASAIMIQFFTPLYPNISSSAFLYFISHVNRCFQGIFMIYTRMLILKLMTDLQSWRKITRVYIMWYVGWIKIKVPHRIDFRMAGWFQYHQPKNSLAHGLDSTYRLNIMFAIYWLPLDITRVDPLVHVC